MLDDPCNLLQGSFNFQKNPIFAKKKYEKTISGVFLFIGGPTIFSGKKL
ncbi:MAG: hypothetical protein K0R36_3090 [Chryseobacterium sp.]|jgi:hypothetical protein|nr:hypothetical protein [Chryseobacterium sp.]